MTCKNCGNFIPENSAYCTRCGRKAESFRDATLKRLNENKLIAEVKKSPYEVALFAISALIFIFSLTDWLTISPDFIKLTSLFESTPYFAGLSEQPLVIRSDYSILNVVNLFFMIFASFQGMWILPFFALFLLVAGFSLLLSNALFVMFLHGKSSLVNILGQLAYFISLAAGLTPFFIAFILNMSVFSEITATNFPAVLLDVRLFSVCPGPYVIILLSVAGLLLLKKLKKRGD